MFLKSSDCCLICSDRRDRSAASTSGYWSLPISVILKQPIWKHCWSLIAVIAFNRFVKICGTQMVFSSSLHIFALLCLLVWKCCLIFTSSESRFWLVMRTLPQLMRYVASQLSSSSTMSCRPSISMFPHPPFLPLLRLILRLFFPLRLVTTTCLIA